MLEIKQVDDVNENVTQHAKCKNCGEEIYRYLSPHYQHQLWFHSHGISFW